MSTPSPPFDLVGHCSAIWNNTLYVYSPQGFASLALEEDAEWQTLQSGQSVTGAACVPAGNEALYIVGGTTGAAGALASYAGLQRYNFAAATWDQLTPTDPVTQDRTKHGAAYIPSMNAILIYAGSRDPAASGLGQETFAVSTLPPYAVTSFNAQGAPALTSPRLMPWSSELAVLVGGAADNTQVWLFGQSQGWSALETTLPPGLGLDSGAKQCTIITGDDGSKVLQLFDMSKSPNVVSRYALVVNGAAAPAGMQIAPPETPASRRRLRTKRQTVANWPAYNGTLAPTTTRDGFSVASGDDGLVVISGGNSQDPLAMFDQKTNTWQNASAVFVRDQQVLLNSISTSLSAAASSTVASSSTRTSAAPSSTSSHASENVLGTGRSKSQVLTTLGASLGAVFGFAAILIIILLLLRWKKQQRKRAIAAGLNEKEHDRLSFADQGADFMKEAGGSRGFASPTSNHSSLNSLQIFQNKTNMGHKRSVPSDSSQVPLAKNKSPLGVSDPLEMSHMNSRASSTFTGKSIDLEKPPMSQPKSTTLMPAAAMGLKDAKDGRTRSNGWSRYFANNDVTNLASMQGGQRNTYNTEVSGISEMSKTSDYSNDRSMVGGSAVPPLELNLGPKFESQRLSAVNTGSPTMGRSKEDIQQGLSAEVRRAGSTSSRGSIDGGYDLASTNQPTPATQTTWTPASRPSLDRPSFDTRADARSIRSNHSGSNPFFASTRENDRRPRKGSMGAPPKLPQLNFGNYGDASRDSTASNVTVFPGGLESPKANAFAKTHAPSGEDFSFMPPKNVFGNDRYRDSSASDVTVFPGAPTGSPARGIAGTTESRNGVSGRKMSSPQDMGWLNLNAGKPV